MTDRPLTDHQKRMVEFARLSREASREALKAHMDIMEMCSRVGVGLMEIWPEEYAEDPDACLGWEVYPKDDPETCYYVDTQPKVGDEIVVFDRDGWTVQITVGTWKKI